MTPMGEWEAALVARLIDDGEPDSAGEMFGENVNAKCRWTESDGAYMITYNTHTVQKIKPGMYDMSATPQGIVFSNVSLRDDDLLKFPGTDQERIVTDITTFWASEDKFREHSLPFKRGIILWGPPGSGKSSTVRLVCQDVIKRGGIVFQFTQPDLFVNGYRVFRQVQPTTPIVVVMEDLDTILTQSNESKILNLLDGAEDAANVIFLATCFEPGARFLTADLRWVPCGDLVEGDEIWAFDAERPAGRGARRRYRRATVTESRLALKECVEVTMSTGEVMTCTTDHPWLAYREFRPKGETRLQWVHAEDLKPGNRLHRPFMPWETDSTWEGGWLAGMLDGEGSVARGGDGHAARASNVSVSQNEGPTADRMVAALLARTDVGVYFQARGPKKLVTATTHGGNAGAAALIGSVRAERLISQFDLSGGMMKNRFPATVVSVRPVGMREVQSIQTSTGTYIAEGFSCHNTNYPERLGGRIMNRPSRFDRVYKIPHPAAAAREMYLERIAHGAPIDIKGWTKATHGLSLAHLKELFIGVYIMGGDERETIRVLKGMRDKHTSAEDDDEFEEPGHGGYA